MSIDKELNKNAVVLNSEELEKLSGGLASSSDKRRIRSALQNSGRSNVKYNIDYGLDDEPGNSGALRS